MAYSDKVRGSYQEILNGMKDAGLLKVERYIHSAQAADIEVEFPEGASLKKVINICANNYLGLSSHPEVVKAAHAGLDSRGYGMSSVRFICGTQDIHWQLEHMVTKFLGTEDTILYSSAFAFLILHPSLCHFFLLLLSSGDHISVRPYGLLNDHKSRPCL